MSATAAYRHFTNKEDLLASVAAEGFYELAAAMQRETPGDNLLTRAGLAYIEFASQNRGLFRLMFGHILAERAKYPALQAASAGVEAMLVRVVAEINPRPIDDNHAAMAAWGLVHGLAHLIVDGLFPVTQATAEAEKILAIIQLPTPPTSKPTLSSSNASTAAEGPQTGLAVAFTQTKNHFAEAPAPDGGPASLLAPRRTNGSCRHSSLGRVVHFAVITNLSVS